MGVLDFLDSPDLLGHLFGVGTANAAPSPPPPPQMPPQGVMGPAQEPFSPTSTMGTMATLGGGGGQPTAPLSFNDRAQPAQEAIDIGTWDPQNSNYTKFMPPAPNGGLQLANRGGGPAGDPNEALAYGGDTRVASADPRFVPSNLPPIMRGNGPPMPPPMAGGGPPTMNQGGGLMSALGLGNQDRQSQFIAGLGKGAAGATGPGGLAAAMRGFGGGVQGSQAKEVEQVAQKRQAENDLFTKTSTAFKDMLAAEAAGDNHAHKAAQMQLLQLQIAAGGVRPGVPKTPYDKVVWVEGQVLKYRDQMRKTMEKKAQQDGVPINEASLDARADAKRKELYAMPGIEMDPKSAGKALNTGATEKNPFETKGMTLEEFNRKVPLGAWFRDQNGNVTTRKKGPPGAGVPAVPGAGASLEEDDAEEAAA